MRRSNRSPAPLALLCLVAAAAAGCSGLGRVPTSLVDLYDRASPDGVIELEIDRDGSIREMEADVPVADLPPAVRAAALAHAPGAEVTGAERELRRDGAAWEVKLLHQGRAWELVLDEAGVLLETEKELDRAEAPAAVLAGADAALPGGGFRSVEVIERGSETEYHVKKLLHGASHKVVLTPEGVVVRVVREARAEIEIPLAR